MGRNRVLTATGMGAGLLSLAGASLAWACSILAPSAYTQGPAEVSAGDTVQVTARNMSAMGTTHSQISIVWETGSQVYVQDLATVPYADSFTVNVAIPADATKGAFYYVAAWDRVAGSRSTPFTTHIFDPNAGASTGGPSGTKQTYGPANQNQYGLGQGNGAPATTNTAPSGGSTASAPVAPRSEPQDQQAPARSTAVKSATAPQGSTIAPKAIVSSAADAPASATSATPIQGAPVQPAAGGNVPANQVLGDLWGGFARGKTTSQAPSLIAAPDSGPGAGLAVGMLAAGLVALFAGFGVAEVRRSRATATSTIE